MPQRPPLTFTGSSAPDVARFVREQVPDLSLLRRVIVEPEQTRVLDVNRSELVFPGVTFGHSLLPVILREAGASFNPATLGTPPATDDGRREFRVSAKYPWAHDRIA
ncbi:MAG TPA: hypothetical protein PLX89_04940 [Verrucomicrobiota bacterium]|nr:hypothetical protein [Verrucomicrobiota bacterium]